MSLELALHLLVFDQDVDVAAVVGFAQSIAFVVVALHYVFVYHLVSTVCTVTSAIFPESTTTVKRALAQGFWSLCLWYLTNVRRVDFNVCGDAIDSESAVVLCNHQSLADHAALAHLATTVAREPLMVPRLNFFSWFTLWRVPTLKTLCNLAKNDENWELDQHLCRDTFEGVLASRHPEWIALFPEVNIWTPESHKLTQMQAGKYFLPSLVNVLYPRFSGLYNVMWAIHSIPNTFTRLYDVTVSYSGPDVPFGAVEEHAGSSIFAAPSLLEVLALRAPLTVNIHVKSRLLSRMPVKKRKIEKWLERAWVDKDKTLHLQKIGFMGQLTIDLRKSAVALSRQ